MATVTSDFLAGLMTNFRVIFRQALDAAGQIEQLKDGGLLIKPLGSVRYYQTLTLIKNQGGELETAYITGVRFVPMTGKALQA